MENQSSPHKHICPKAAAKGNKNNEMKVNEGQIEKLGFVINYVLILVSISFVFCIWAHCRGLRCVYSLFLLFG